MSRPGWILGKNRNKEGEIKKLVIQEQTISLIIEKWLGKLYWKPIAFESILKQAGIELPAVLSDYDKNNHNFTCTTSRGKKYILQILFGNCDDFSEISITDGDEVKNYEIRFNYKNDDNPVITLASRKFKCGNKIIKGNYTSWYSWEVEYGNNESMSISIKNPSNYRINTQKCKDLEEYLLALEFDSTLDIRNIFETIIDKLSITNETLENCEKISVIYSKKTENDWEEKGKIIVESGHVSEYQLFRKGNTYHVFSNGNWEYVADGVKITSDDDIITVSITGNTDKIASANPYSLLQDAENVIGLLWESVW